MARRMAGDFDVVVDPMIVGGDLVILAFEKRLLEIPAGSPRQHRSDLQVLARHVTLHVLREDALRWALIVRAAGGVYVMVSRIPSHLRQIDPSLETKSQCLRGIAGDFKRL